MDVHRCAFGQTNEANLVRDLLDDPTAQPRLSLIAEHEDRPIGHVLFTRIRVSGADVTGSILCPLAVLPDRQRQGVGGALITSGLQRLREADCNLVFVLGDPQYYERFGFQQADLARFPTPQTIPEEYHPGWMVQSLLDTSLDQWQGKVSCAETLNDPAYWNA